jgi:hypothetical protein
MFEIKLSKQQIKELKNVPLDFEIFTMEDVPIKDTFGKNKYREALVDIGTVLGAKVESGFLLFELKLENHKQSTNFFWLKNKGMIFDVEIEPFVKMGRKPQIQVVLRNV